MIKEQKKNLIFLVEVIAFILFILLCVGIFFLVTIFNGGKTEAWYYAYKDISLEYALDVSTKAKIEVTLNDKEKNELYELVENLEFEDNVTDCLIMPIYYIKYDDNELFLDKTCGLAYKNGKDVSIAKGREEISKYLEELTKDIKDVYLFTQDKYTLETKEIKISKDDKNMIRKLWSLQDQTESSIYVDSLSSNYLYIDDAVITIDSYLMYASYNDEGIIKTIMLSDEFIKLLEKYISVPTEECCSCCPDLKPGESCIAMCCPCS